MKAREKEKFEMRKRGTERERNKRERKRKNEIGRDESVGVETTLGLYFLWY